MEEIIKNNLKSVFNDIENGNNLGEKITLVGASKFVDEETIKLALKHGLKILGDNKVQEFRDKTSKIEGAEYHFIGTLQKNKVKYLIGRVSLIHSVDSISLAQEISKQSVKNNVTTNILLEVNLGEENKGGFPYLEAKSAVKEISEMENIRVLGLMAMLPDVKDEKILASLCLQMRQLYDILVSDGYEFKHLSIGMSGDYKIAIKNGSNMIRLGTILFGKRNYDIN